MGSLSKFRKTPHQKTYGIEWEFVVNGEHYFQGYHRMFCYTSDLSISPPFHGQRGVEAISQPLPYKWLIKEIDKCKLKEHLVTNGSCGIHVHVSRKLTSSERMLALLNFMSTLNAVNQLDFFGRPYNRYCSPLAVTQSKFCAINFLHKDSYEFRVFASGDAEWAKECVRRTKLMVEYRGKLTVDNFYKLFGLTR